MTAPVFITGDNPSATQVNSWFVNTTFAFKTANQSVTSSAVVVDDNHLSIAVDASTTYQFEMFMNTTSASSTPDLAWRLLGPSGSVIYGVSIGPDATAAATTGPHQIQATSITTLYSNSARYAPTLVRGLLVTSVTAGTFKLQWAQQTSDATATTMQTGSYLNLVRVS